MYLGEKKNLASNSHSLYKIQGIEKCKEKMKNRMQHLEITSVKITVYFSVFFPQMHICKHTFKISMIL